MGHTCASVVFTPSLLPLRDETKMVLGQLLRPQTSRLLILIPRALIAVQELQNKLIQTELNKLVCSFSRKRRINLRQITRQIKAAVTRMVFSSS